MVISLTAGGIGINLTASHIAVFNDFDYVPANLLQAEDRICRMGQAKECLIYYMMAMDSKIDKSVSNIIIKKLQNIDNVIEDLESKKDVTRELIDLLK